MPFLSADTHTQTHKVTDTIDHAAHALATAGIGNKIFQSNLGKTALCRKLPTGYNGTPHICRQNYPLL